MLIMRTDSNQPHWIIHGNSLGSRAKVMRTRVFSALHKISLKHKVPYT